jgi:putative ABC transport system ATP-binding protein
VTQPSLVAVHDVHKSFRRGSETVHALAGVDLALGPGELVALVGRSGSGKTTLLNVLAGWERADSGRVMWMGEDRATSMRALPWHGVAVLPQSLGLIEELSVRGNVQLPARLAGRLDEEAERAEQLIVHFGLLELADRPPEEISLGEQQRTALARALILRPDLLLVDEPTGHQDATWATRVIASLNVAAGEGTCCLVATHSDEVAAFASRTLHMEDGRIAAGSD